MLIPSAMIPVPQSYSLSLSFSSSIRRFSMDQERGHVVLPSCFPEFHDAVGCRRPEIDNDCEDNNLRAAFHLGPSPP